MEKENEKIDLNENTMMQEETSTMKEKDTQKEETPDEKAPIEEASTEEKVATEEVSTEEKAPIEEVPSEEKAPTEEASSDAIEFFNGGIDELTKMFEDVNKRDELITEIKTLASEGKKLEKQLSDEKKSFESDLNKTVESEREKYVSQENKVINEAAAELKKVKNERSKAKERGVRERIDNETAQLIAENKGTRRYIRKTLKENGLPACCDTKWFYTLYCTQSFLEWIVKILVFALGLVLIPWLVVEIVDPWFFLKFILWVVVAVVFIAIYMTIFLVTKDKDNGTLEEMREFRDKIDDNNKAIKKIKKNIKTDLDESQYNLEKYDLKMQDLQNSLDNATSSKEQKLKVFEEVEKQKVIDSINAKHVPLIESKQKEIDEKADLYQLKSSEFGQLSKLIEEKYEKYLTKPYTNAGCIKNMIQMVNQNGAANIGAAYAMVKNQK